jgi:hypothetical protein
LDAEKEPLLSQLLSIRPIPLVHGLPVLHTSTDALPHWLGDQVVSQPANLFLAWSASGLRWCEDWEVYVLGAYAALQLGPDAINLAGARAGGLRLFDAVSSHDVVVRQEDDNGKDRQHTHMVMHAWVNPTTGFLLSYPRRRSAPEEARVMAVPRGRPQPILAPD